MNRIAIFLTFNPNVYIRDKKTDNKTSQQKILTIRQKGYERHFPQRIAGTVHITKHDNATS